MKSVYKITLLVGITILVSSCKDDLKPNYQYMPNMYEPVSYGTYSQADVFKGGKEGQLPVDGTINRGFEAYEYPDTPEALIAVKAANIKSPLGPLSVKDMEKAKVKKRDLEEAALMASLFKTVATARKVGDDVE